MVQNQILQRKTIFIIDFSEICYSFQKILKTALGNILTRYLQTVLRLTVIQNKKPLIAITEVTALI